MKCGPHDNLAIYLHRISCFLNIAPASSSEVSTTLLCQQVFDAKRLIGRKFADPIVQADIKLWPFKCIAGQGDKPMIVINAQGEEKLVLTLGHFRKIRRLLNGLISSA